MKFLGLKTQIFEFFIWKFAWYVVFILKKVSLIRNLNQKLKSKKDSKLPYCLDVYTEDNFIVFKIPHVDVSLLFLPKNVTEGCELKNF